MSIVLGLDHNRYLCASNGATSNPVTITSNLESPRKKKITKYFERNLTTLKKSPFLFFNKFLSHVWPRCSKLRIRRSARVSKGVKRTNSLYFLLLDGNFNPFFASYFVAVIIGLWVIGITVQEIKHALYQGKERYLGEWWHLAIIPMIIFYILAAVLWIVGYALAASNVGEWTLDVDDLLGSSSRTPYRLLLLSNTFYSFALVLTFFEASHFFQVNSTLGPLHLSLMMMLKDIIRFLALFALNVFAFALAMRKLYSQYVHTSSPVKELNNSTTSHSFERYEADIAGNMHIVFFCL